MTTLTAQEWYFLLRALVLLPWISLRISQSGYQRTLRTCEWSGRTPSALSAIQAHQLSQAMARMINIASRYGAYQANCLGRSLVLLRMMSQKGIEGELVLGAKLKNSSFDAHAWVQLRGEVVNDLSTIDQIFCALN